MNEQIRVRTVFKKVVKENAGLSIGLSVTIVSSIVASLIPPLVLKEAVNSLTKGQEVALGVALLYFALLAVTGVLDAAKEALITMFGQKMTRGLRYEMCKKLSRLSAKYFTEHEAGKITSRLVNDVDTVESLFTNGIISMIADACKVIGILIMIFIMSKGLGCMMVCLLPVLFYMTRQIQKKMLSAQIANRVAISKVNNHVPETISNIRMIHTYGKERYMEKRYDHYIEESYEAVEKSNFYDAIYSPIILSISAVVIAVMMILSSMGGGMRSFFGMSVGTAVAIIAYVGKVFDPLESIGMEIENIQSAVAGIKRTNEFLEEPERVLPVENVPAPLEEKTEKMTPCIALDGVTFGYGEESLVLREKSLAIKAGENVTLAGRTGVGKSTIFKLILGMYSPQSGKVSIYGVGADKIKDKEKRGLFGYVGQSFAAVPGTIADEITLYDETITNEEVEVAAKLTGIHDAIMQLERGYETEYKDTLFSKGQIQLLSIARAIVKNPPILLLDEITANLDSSTEKSVLDAMALASRNRTVLSISHRLYEERKEGRIVYLEE